MKIAFANDHAALTMREPLLKYLEKGGHEILDVGAKTEESVDYPDFAKAACRAVQDNKADLAILMCGTGIGISIAANKMKGIRCALCTDEYAAQMAREHNNANALALRGRRIDPERNISIIECFLNTQYEAGRHQRRVDKITAMESDQ